MTGGIWGDKPMTTLDAFVVSLSGMATVFVVLVSLAIAIVIMGKILNAMGVTKAQETKVVSTSQKPASAPVPVATKPVEEDMEEYAVILAAVSEHTRTPIERLKVTSITKR